MAQNLFAVVDGYVASFYQGQVQLNPFKLHQTTRGAYADLWACLHRVIDNDDALALYYDTDRTVKDKYVMDKKLLCGLMRQAGCHFTVRMLIPYESEQCY